MKYSVRSVLVNYTPTKGRGFRGLNIMKVTWKGIDNSMLQMS